MTIHFTSIQPNGYPIYVHAEVEGRPGDPLIDTMVKFVRICDWEGRPMHASEIGIDLLEKLADEALARLQEKALSE